MKTEDLFICEVCGNSSKNQDRIRACEENHVDPIAFKFPNYRGGVKYPHEVTVIFANGAKAIYSPLTSVDESGVKE